MLAIGLRYANRNDPTIKAFLLPDRDTTIHVKAKQLAEQQFERLNGAHAVQALLLLSDLEFGVGRYNTGWMYTGQ